MGGDGGTVTSNRRYLRGAGSASHTADAKRSSSGGDDAAAGERERLHQTMTTCAVTGAVLDLRPKNFGGGSSDGALSGGDIVACPYGRLYGREAAVEALLRRREVQQQTSNGGRDQPEPDIGWHVRGLRDLHPVRFHVVKQDGGGDGAGNGNGAKTKGGGYVAACPMTGVELTGSMPAYLIVRKKKEKKNGKDKSGEGTSSAAGNERGDEPNVLSERAIREVGADSLQEEYGPFDEADCIRLAPPSAGGVLAKVKSDLERRREEERLAKKAKKKEKGDPSDGGKKRKKKGGTDVGGAIKTAAAVASSSSATNKAADKAADVQPKRPKHGNGGLAQVARSSVATAVASNPVLSSLFNDGKKSSVSDKEKRDNLFTRNS